MKRSFLLIACWGFSLLLVGQQINQQLSLENFLSLVTLYHPVSKQADLVTLMARANKLSARGGFDPVLSSSLDNKFFNDKNYWFLLDAKLEVPTWYGIELKAGYQYWQGDYFDAHERTPDIGLPYAGISVSLGKGLFMDDRMAGLKQAKIYADMAEYEKQLMVNDLYFEAIQAYLDWTFKYYQYDILNEATSLAMQRFESTRIQFLLGDKPAMDTLEMYTIYQTRLLGLIAAKNELSNAQLKVSNFLWFENNLPIQLPDSIVPLLTDSLHKDNLFTQDSLQTLIRSLSAQNPILSQLQLKQKQLGIEKLLKTNKLLPQLDVSYNFLYNENANMYFTDNYKLGVEFKFPIFVRKEVGDLKLTKYKMQDNQFKISYKTYELNNKVNAYFNDYTALREQLNTNNAALVNYKLLLDAETKKFQIGEGTVFMVNSRETKYLESLIKVKEMETKVVKSLYGIYWSAGTLAL
jgi:outer membrane protein TolC